MKKKLVIIGILLLIVALVGVLVVKMMYKKAERNVAKEQAVIVDPLSFIKLFKNEEDSANALYLTKVIQLTGVVNAYTTDTANQHYITIKIADSLPSIKCELVEKYKSINVSDTVTIKGICVAILTDINLGNCIIIDSKKYTGSISIPEKAIIQTDSIRDKKITTDTAKKVLIFKTQKAQISFDAGGGLEDIKAINNQVEATLDETGNISFKLAMLQFKFADALMQQHFNEEYVESSKYPTAKFTGKITNVKDVNISKEGIYPATITGQLTIHGKTKEVKTVAQLIVKNSKIQATSNFKIILSDFGVKSAAADEAQLKITANF